MITIKNLNKSFKNTEVLKDINLSFEIGKMYGILGRNGVGKTTLLKTINRRMCPTSGNIDYGNLINNNIVDIQGFYKSTDNLYSPLMTTSKILIKEKKLNTKFDLEYALSLLDKFKISRKKSLLTLNNAQINILGSIITLSSNKTILIFDEPIQYLDLEFRNIFYGELINLCTEEQHIILISTHIINEIQNIISDVVIIKETQVVVNEEVESLREKNNNLSLEEIFMKEVGN